MTIRKFGALVATLALALCSIAPAAAQTYNFNVYVDADNNSATGCNVTFANGTVQGAEVHLQATVNAGTSPNVVSVTRQVCSGGVFGAGTVVGGAYPVGVGNGSGGGSVVELNDTLTALRAGTSSGPLRLYVVSTSALGDDLLFTTDGTGSGAPILYTPSEIPPESAVEATPLFGVPALIVLFGLVLLIGSRGARRRALRRIASLMVLASGIAWAAGIFVSNGQVAQWTGISPIATDPAGDPTSGERAIDLRAFFAASQLGNVFFRIDVANINAPPPPIAVDDAYSASANATLVIAAPGVLGNDTLNGATIVAHTNPSHGSLTLNGDGSFSFTPTSNYTGSDSFAYTLGSTGGTSTATVSLNVVTGPVAVADSYSTRVGSGLHIAAPGLLTNDQLGAPTATLTSFGGGDAGGTVTSNAPGGSATLDGAALVVNADGSFTLGGPTTAGTYTFSYRIGNSQGTSDGVVTIQVNQAPVITSANTTTFVVGSANAFNVTTTGTPSAAITESGALPSGVTLVDNGNGTATLSGNPPAGSGGTYAIVLTADDGIAPAATQTFNLVVQQAPAITSANTTTFTVGTAGSFTVTTTGTPAPTLSESGTLPTGVTFNAGTGVLSGTPAAGTGGSYAITFGANNGVGTAASQSFTLIVDQAPAITSANTTTFTVGTAGSFTVTATGTPAPTLSESGTLPTGVTFNAATGVLSGTPAAGTGGSYPITFGANNGVGTAATQSFTLIVDQAPAITSANTTTFTVGTAGSFTVTTTGTPAPTLSESGALPAGVTFNAATGVLSGTPGAGTSGSYPITFGANNGVGTAASQSFTLIVDQAPAITSANTTTFTVGTPGSFTVTTTGYPNPVTAETGALPSGVTLVDNGNGTATLAGTPAANTGGTYPITLNAGNGVGTPATQSFSLVVQQAPSITSANTTTFTTGAAGSFTVTATGTPSPTLSESGALPSGVTFNAGTGVLSGTPAAGTGGSYPITFGANNGVGTAASQSFTLTVDQAPAITSANTTTFVVGSANAFNVTTTGTPNAAISESGALPSGVTLVDNGNGTATLSGNPPAGSGGTYAIGLTADNGIAPAATQAFNLVVQQAPAITSANTTTFTVGTAGSFTVTATGTPAPTLSESGTLPTGVTFNAGTGVLSGTPAAGTGGSYAITFGANNGVGTAASQSFTLIVDQAPAITSANTTTFTVGTAGSFTVTATGTPAPTLSESGTLPTGVTFNAATGVLSGTPAAGTGGSYPISFGANNGVGSAATQSFTLIVDQAPAITSANTTTFTVGTAGSFTVTATGTPAPTLSESGALPAGVTFNAGTGVLSGTPGAGTGGSYPITFGANNGVGTAASQSFTLIVDQAPAITSANTTTFTVGTAGSFTVTATGTPAPTLSESGTLPTGVTFNAATGVLSGTPAAGTGGSYPITFGANNGVGSAATQSFTLIVDQAPAITSANTTTFTVGTAGSFTVTATGTPAPTLSESGTLPTGVTFNAGTGVLSGTPAAGTGGSYAITFGANNGVGTAASQSFTLIVDEAPAITSANTTTFTIGSAGTFSVVASGFPASTFSETGALPSGVTLSSAGLLSGTAASGTAGSYPITITANNGIGSPASQLFTLVVQSPCSAITVSGSLPNGFYQTAYSSPFTQTGGTAPITWSATGLPAGLSIGSTTGIVSGTPTTTVAAATVVISVSDTNGCPGSTTLSGFKVAPIATGDSYSTVGNTPLQVGGSAPATPYVASATTIFGNDSGPGTLTTTATTAATSLGGSVTIAANGSFTYTPKVNTTGTDTFTYSVIDGNSVSSAPATVSITVSGMVWYVNGSAATNGNGEASTPFNTLNSANTAQTANSTIFVSSGASATSTPGTIALIAGTTLWGQGSSLPAIGGITIQNTAAAATKPKLTGAVSLAGNNVTVSSLDINTSTSPGFSYPGPAVITGALVENNVTVTTTAGNAISLTNAGGTLTFLAVSSSGGTSGISLTNTTGTFTVTGVGTTAGSGGTLANSTVSGIALSNAASVSFNNMTFQSSAGTGIDALDVGTFVVATSSFSGYANKGVFIHTSTTNTTGGTFNVHNNTMTGIGGAPIGTDFKGSAGYTGHLTTNVIGTLATANSGSLTDDGIDFVHEGTGTVTVDISNNTISQIKSGYGVNATASAAAPNHLNVSLINNTVNMVQITGEDGLSVHQQTLNGFVCVNASGNHSAAAGLAASDPFGVDAVGLSTELAEVTATYQVQGSGVTGTNTAAMMAFLNSNNTLSGPGGGSAADIQPGNTTGFTSAVCPTAP